MTRILFTDTQKKAICLRIIEKWATDKYVITDLCENEGISKISYYRWIKDFPGLEELHEEATAQRIEARKTGLKERALKGLEIRLTKHIITEEKKIINPQTKKETVIHKQEKVVWPSDSAIFFTLTNTDPDNWKNKYNHDHTSKGEKITGFEMIAPENQPWKCTDCTSEFVYAQIVGNICPICESEYIEPNETSNKTK